MNAAVPENVAAEFTIAFGHRPAGTWTAPGRVNLIGEHTDYNGGYVLPIALDRRVTAAAAAATAGVSIIRSRQQGTVGRFAAATVAPGDVAGWAAYVAGVCWALRSGGYAVPDIELFVDSGVPVGAGLSSSAALGCAAARAMVDLAGVDVGGTELALLVRRAENDFVGVPTGVMDQMASIQGRDGNAMFLDTRSLLVEQLPFDPAAHGLALLVVDTGAPHRLADGQYAQRRAMCHLAAQTIGVPALRDVPADDLDQVLRRLPDLTMRRRVRHVVTENARVLDVVDVLRSRRDLREIGPAFTASHVSLREDFEVSSQRQDLAVDCAIAAGAYGARMTGAGFGGAIIALVESIRQEALEAAVADAFRSRGFDPPTVFAAVASSGAARAD